MKKNGCNDAVTKSDLDKFGKKIEKKIEEKMDNKFDILSKTLENKMDSRFDILSKTLENKIDAKLASSMNLLNDNLALWKSEIFNLVDGLAIEIRDGREHRAITSHLISENTRRVSQLEKKVFGVSEI